MSRRVTRWQVSDLATEFQINPRTIRYYERVGLLRASTRTPAGYRVYSDADRARLQFILKAKATGLTLNEISEVLALRDKGVAPCERVLGLVQAKLDHLDRQVEALLDFRKELVAIQQEAGSTNTEACVCGLIEDHESHQTIESLRLATEFLSHRPARVRRS